MFDAMKAHGNPALKKPGDMITSPSTDGYAAVIRQAVAAGVNAGLPGAAEAWARINSAPTVVRWSSRFDVVPVTKP
jgi:hypothetical protein